MPFTIAWMLARLGSVALVMRVAVFGMVVLRAWSAGSQRTHELDENGRVLRGDALPGLGPHLVDERPDDARFGLRVAPRNGGGDGVQLLGQPLGNAGIGNELRYQAGEVAHGAVILKDDLAGWDDRSGRVDRRAVLQDAGEGAPGQD